MRIGEVAAQAGVSVRSLRYYEEQGLVSAQRSHSGQRHYAEGAVDRVRLIQRLYAAGLASTAIRELLPCVHTGIATAETLARLGAERVRIDAQVRDLMTTRDKLDEVIRDAETANGCSPVVGAAAATA